MSGLLYHAKVAGSAAGPVDWPDGYDYPGPPWPAGWEHEIPSSTVLVAADRSERSTGYRYEPGPSDGTGAPTRLAAYETAIDDGDPLTDPGSLAVPSPYWLSWTWVYSDTGSPGGWEGSMRRTLWGFDTSAVGSPSSARLKLETIVAYAAPAAVDEGGPAAHDSALGDATKLYIFDAEGVWAAISAGSWNVWNAALVPLLGGASLLAEVTITQLRAGDQYIDLSAVPTERSGRRWLLFCLSTSMGLTLSPDTYPTLPTYVDASAEGDEYGNPDIAVNAATVSLEVTP